MTSRLGYKSEKKNFRMLIGWERVNVSKAMKKFEKVPRQKYLTKSGECYASHKIYERVLKRTVLAYTASIS